MHPNSLVLREIILLWGGPEKSGLFFMRNFDDREVFPLFASPTTK